ncbi:hypothetical protein M0R04_08660 [Candidatus Dojkabacteria bacterium]|jgi:hypothetical protein|nr:hypothetical protein [Candidatus Dojkabacteria bacterium]
MIVKSEQSLRIIKFAKENPCFNRSKIANHYNISRERVRQILSSAGVNTRHLQPPKQPKLCKCGNVITDKYYKYCKKCREVKLRCVNCNKLFKRHLSDINYRVKVNYNNNFLCSNKCKGEFLSKTKKQNNYNAIWKMHLKTGYGNVKLQKLFPQCSRATISRILHYYRGDLFKIIDGKKVYIPQQNSTTLVEIKNMEKKE